MRACLWSGIVVALAAGNLRAATIDIALEDFQASGVLSYTFNGAYVYHGSSGIFRLHTSNYSGPPASSGLTNPEFGFCIELAQNFTGQTKQYSVGDLTTANDPVSLIAGPITPERRDLLRQHWALHYDPTWELPGPYSTSQITEAMAFHSIIFEILNDFDGTSLGSMNLSSGIFTVVTGHILDVNDPLQELPVFSTASSFLGDLSLTYAGPLPRLCALTNPNYQDYVVACVPEVSSLFTLTIISSVALLGWRRSRQGGR